MRMAWRMRIATLWRIILRRLSWPNGTRKSGLLLRRFFNTSGQLYRQHNVKAQLDAGMSDAEAYDLLASNGMLVKRPIVVGPDFVLTGFREADWEAALL